MLSLQSAGRDPLTYVMTLAGLLRAVLPRRWWYRLVGDPVRLILHLPPLLLPLVLKAMVTAPDSDRDVSQEDEDPIEIIRRAQRKEVHGAHERGGITLAVAALSVRAVYGDGWYYAPERWPTSDGYVPFAVALVEYAGVQALDVRRRLEFADGYGIAHAKDPQRVRQQMERLAYPAEVC
jgi:hypothetical protein